MKKNIFIIVALIVCFVATPAMAGKWVAISTNGSSSGSGSDGIGDTNKKCYLVKYSVPDFTCAPSHDDTWGSNYTYKGFYDQSFSATSVYAVGQGTVSGTQFTGILKPNNRTFSSNYFVSCGNTNKNICTYLCLSANGCNSGWNLKWYADKSGYSYYYYFFKGKFDDCANPSYAPYDGYYQNFKKTSTIGGNYNSNVNGYDNTYFSYSNAYGPYRSADLDSAKAYVLSSTALAPKFGPLDSATPYQAWVYVSGMEIVAATRVDCVSAW